MTSESLRFMLSKVSRRELLAALQRMGDAELLASFEECVVPLAETPEDVEELRRYFRARKSAPYWGPGGKGNNHANIQTKRSKQTK